MDRRNVLKLVQNILHTPRRRLIALFAGIVIPLALFGDLVEDIWTEGGRPWDLTLQNLIHSYDTPGRDRQMRLISDLGYLKGVLPLDVAVFLALLARKRPGQARFFGVAVGGSALLNGLVKVLFRRKRPALGWNEVPTIGTYSFPSGHAMASLSTVAGLIVLAWPTP
jgi:undecaprenyl-diphosphatase